MNVASQSARCHCAAARSGSRAGSRSRGWAPRAHQLELLAKARAGRSVLLIAPTGAGKTLAGFLPSLVELSDARLARERRRRRAQARLHRPRRPPRGRAAHALHLAAQGARRRHRAQPRSARSPRWACRSGSRPAPATRRPPSASASAAIRRDILLTHAGAAGADPRLARRAVSVRLAQARRARRVACAGHLEARRPAVARPGAAVHACAATSPASACRRRWPSRRSAPLSGAAAEHGAALRRSRGRRRRRRAGRHHARHRRAAALGRPFGAPCASARSTS